MHSYSNLRGFLRKVAKEYGDESYKYGIASIQEQTTMRTAESLGQMAFLIRENEIKGNGRLTSFLIKLASKETPDEKINSLWFLNSSEAEFP